MKTDANEPIYPDKHYGNYGGSGLTKREYFAGLAMRGMCADSKLDDTESIVRSAVHIADTLIEELNKETK